MRLINQWWAGFFNYVNAGSIMTIRLNRLVNLEFRSLREERTREFERQFPAHHLEGIPSQPIESTNFSQTRCTCLQFEQSGRESPTRSRNATR